MDYLVLFRAPALAYAATKLGASMTVVRVLHIACGCVWLAVVILNFAAEISGDVRLRWFASKSPARLDLIVEMPAFLVVLLSGGFLMRPAAARPGLTLQAAAGLVALGLVVYASLTMRGGLKARGAADWPAGDARKRKFPTRLILGALFLIAIGAHILPLS